VVLSGRLDDLQTALEAASYHPARHNTHDDALWLYLSDMGRTGAESCLAEWGNATLRVPIHIVSVNDAPVVELTRGSVLQTYEVTQVCVCVWLLVVVLVEETIHGDILTLLLYLLHWVGANDVTPQAPIVGVVLSDVDLEWVEEESRLTLAYSVTVEPSIGR
jgi:hypothetical protein